MNIGKVYVTFAFALIVAGGWGIVDYLRTVPNENARKTEREGGFLKGDLEREFLKNMDVTLTQHRNNLLLFHSALFIGGIGLASWGFYRKSRDSSSVEVAPRDSPSHEICSICGTTLSWLQRTDGVCASCKKKADPTPGR